MTATSLRTEFETDGFVVLEDVGAGEALDRLKRAAAHLEDMARDQTHSTDDFILEAAGPGGWVAWQRGDSGIPGLLRSVSNAHVHEPDLLRVAEDIQLADRHVRPVVGGSEVSIINVFLWAKPAKVGSEKPWHQDMAFAPPGFTDNHRNVVTVWCALDPATPENGCLEFVPGSHTLGVFPHVGSEERTGDQPRVEQAEEPHVPLDQVLPDSKPVPVPLRPGSAVMFDGMILHRSATNTATTPRRAISFVFAVGRDQG
jgi:Phytanoyl-CoA dioxygenase (PhyH)